MKRYIQDNDKGRSARAWGKRYSKESRTWEAACSERKDLGRHTLKGKERELGKGVFRGKLGGSIKEVRKGK